MFLVSWVSYLLEFAYHYKLYFILAVALYLLRKYFNGPKSEYFTDLEGKTIIITGCSSGIGKETAKELLRAGATVIFACRNKEKTEKVMQEIIKTTKCNKAKAKFIELDLCSFKSIRSFANGFANQFKSLDILINNAGKAPGEKEFLTEDNIDDTWHSNYFGHYYLTNLLIEAGVFNKKKGRIIILSSRAHTRVNLESFQKFNNYIEHKDPNVYFTDCKENQGLSNKKTIYNLTKLANIYHTVFLANKLKENANTKHIKVVSLHPGLVNSSIWDVIKEYGVFYKIFFYIMSPLAWFFFKTNKMGAQTTLYCVHCPDEEIVSGSYYKDCKLCDMHTNGKNEEIRNSFMRFTDAIMNNSLKSMQSKEK